MSKEGTTDGSALGFDPEPAPEADPLSEDFVEPETPDDSSPQPEAEKEPEKEAEPGAEKEPEAEKEAEKEPEAEKDDALYAGRFRSVEDLESSFKQTQAWGTKMAQQAADARRQAEAVKSELEGLRKQQDSMQALVQQQLAEQNPEYAEQLAQQRAIESAVDERVGVEARRMQEAFEQAQLAERANQMRAAFVSRHPDIATTPGLENQVADVIRGFNSMGDEDWALDVNDPEAQDVAYEIAKEPRLQTELVAMDWAPTRRALEVLRETREDTKLRAFLRINPQYAENEDGMAFARQMISGPEIEKARKEADEETKQASEEARKKAYVEPGNSGSPSGGTTDEFDEVLQLAARERKSVLGV